MCTIHVPGDFEDHKTVLDALDVLEIQMVVRHHWVLATSALTADPSLQPE